MQISPQLVMAAQLLLALSILVFIHELGHFLAAKAFGIRVEKFYVFFDAGGRKLFSFTRGETEYGIGWLPLGGYVKIVGMIDESLDKDQMQGPPEPWEFRAKPNWQKFIVMVAGVVMNVILGVLLYAFYLGTYEKGYVPREIFNQDGVYAYETARDYGFQTGDQLIAWNGNSRERWFDMADNQTLFFGGEMLVLHPNGNLDTIVIPKDHYKAVRSGIAGFLEMRNEVWVDTLSPELSYATEAGLEVNDRIVSINGDPVFAYGEFYETLQQHKNGNIDLEVDRGGRIVALQSQVDSSGRIGFIPDLKIPYGDSTYYTFGTAFSYGAKDAWNFLTFNARAMGLVVTGKLPFGQSIESPIGIAKYFGGQWVWSRFWWLTAILSMVLAFMNILPIPALDGGHIMFIVIETISGRKLSDAFMEKAQIFGMILILALMVFAFGGDIIEIIQNWGS
jgi:regulator of sigma E protease